MTKKYRILVLTDHSGHSDQNSVYAILNQLITHPKSHSTHVASRGLDENTLFFAGMQRNALFGSQVNQEFKFSPDGDHFKRSIKKLNPIDFDLILMRLPRPISDDFLLWLDEVFSHATIINNPKGIKVTSNKKYLINFREVCPDIQICYSIEAIQEEIAKHPIVLKPLKEYGGRGLLRIDGDIVDDGMNEYDTNHYLEAMKESIETEGYLSMRYLKNVTKGDKRILVVGGEILAASLRLPAHGSWICNVAQGGSSNSSEVTEREKEIIEFINPKMKENGILIFGADTLVNDDGQRILSEINTLSIGGFPQAEKQTGKPIIKSLLDKIFEYADERNR